MTPAAPRSRGIVRRRPRKCTLPLAMRSIGLARLIGLSNQLSSHQYQFDRHIFWNLFTMKRSFQYFDPR